MIAITRDDVMLVRECCTVDLWEFERLAAQGLAGSEQAPLEAAAALYQGAFLAGFRVHAAVDFEDWPRTQQERVHGLAVQVLAALAAACAACGESAQAIAAQRRILELETLARGSAPRTAAAAGAKRPTQRSARPVQSLR